MGATNTTGVDLQPITITLTFNSAPSGLQLTVGSTTAAAPFTRTVIQGSSNSLSALSPQTLNGTSYAFSSWSDGGAETHNVTANSAADLHGHVSSGSTAHQCRSADDEDWLE